MRKVSVELMGGLGNQLFQLAYLDFICKETNSEPFLYQYGHITHHSNTNYLDTIFSEWKHLYKQLPIHQVIRENEVYTIKNGINTKFEGYFQNYKYILPNFISKLTFASSILSKYPDIQDFDVAVKAANKSQKAMDWRREMLGSAADGESPGALLLRADEESLRDRKSRLINKMVDTFRKYPQMLEKELTDDHPVKVAWDTW